MKTRLKERWIKYLIDYVKINKRLNGITDNMNEQIIIRYINHKIIIKKDEKRCKY